MELLKDGTRYIVRSTFEERALPKAAGFRWDPDRRHWWTSDQTVATRLARYATPEVVSELAELATQREQTVALSRANAVAPEVAATIPAPEGLSYLPFQLAGITYALGRPATLIGDEMGLGKTIQAIGVINADPTIDSVLIICPASLKLNWQRELARWLTRPLRVVVVNGTWPTAPADVYIVNWDLLVKHSTRLHTRGEWDLLVADEAHYAKTPTAQRTVQLFGTDDYAAKKFRAKGQEARIIPPIRARRKVLLTGTPIANRPAELFPLIHYLDPAAWPNFFGFAKKYCNAHNNGFGWDFGGANKERLPELQERLRESIFVRRRKADVLTELPPKRRQVIEIPAPDAAARRAVAAEQAAYAAQEERLADLRGAVELAKAADDPAAYDMAVSRLREGARVAFAEISRQRHETALAKLPAVIEHVQSVLEAANGETKLVLFAHHHDVVAGLAAALADAGVVVLTGETPLAERQVAVDRFQSDPTVHVFLGSISAAGVGLTLTASSHVVFAELDWVPGNLSQAEDRTHRIGQVHPVLVQHLVLDESLDARMAHTLVAKQATLDAALDAQAAQEPVLPQAQHDPAATSRTTRAQITAEAATLTEAQVATIHTGLQILAGLDPDRAGVLNGAGFNKLDSAIGHSLAASPHLTTKQAALGLRLVNKYRRQLGPELVAQAKGRADGDN